MHLSILLAQVGGSQQEAGAGEILANLSIGYIVLAAFILTLIRLALVPSRSPVARSVAELVESLIIAGVLVFLVIRPFFLQAFYIPSESMEPTLMGHEKGMSKTNEEYPETIHDHIFVNKFIYRLREPHPKDIIVFRAPPNADSLAESEGRKPVENVLIKRLIAAGGDKLQIKEDESGVLRVYVNDKPLTDPYIKEPMVRQDWKYPADDKPLVLAENELFVMGDNRNHSNDSRFWGPLKRDRVIGKAMFIFWPLKRIGIVR